MAASPSQAMKSSYGNSPQPMSRGGHPLRKSHRTGPKSYQNLFVACVPKTLSNTEFHQLFEPHGCITAAIMMEPSTGKSKGFGFVTFPTDEAGRAAIEALNGVTVSVRELAFSMHISPSRHDIAEESSFVYFRNVPTILGADTIRAVFAHYGTVVNYFIRADPEKEKEMSLVMIEYSSIEEARAAIRQCNGEIMFPQISTTPIMAKFADPGAIKTHLSHTALRRQPLPKTLPIAIRRQSSVEAEHCGASAELISSSPYANVNPDRNGSEPSSFVHHQSYGSSLPSFHGGMASEPSSLARDLADADSAPLGTGGSLVSAGCSLNDIPNGKLYRHDPYSRNGYVVTPTLTS